MSSKGLKVRRLFLDDPPTSERNRFVRKGRAKNLVARGICREIKPGLIQDQAISKMLAQYGQPRVLCVPRLKKPRRPENLILWYPHKDQGSARRVTA